MATQEDRAVARASEQFEVTEADEKLAAAFLQKHKESTDLTLYTEKSKGKHLGLFIIRTAPGLRGDKAEGSRETLVKQMKGDLPWIAEWIPFESAPIEVFVQYFAAKYGQSDAEMTLCKRAIQQENVYTRAGLSRKKKGAGRRNVYRQKVA